VTLSDLVAKALADYGRTLRVACPGTVESYDATKQTVDVLPSVGEGEPVIPSVPVVFPSAGDFALTMPVQRGDRVTLVFADRSLDEWWGGRSVEPADPRTHARTDCVALLGGRPGSAPLANVDTARAVLGPSDSASPRVACASGAVHLGVGHGEAGTQSAMRGQAHMTALDSFIDSLKTALSTVLATGANGGGPVAFAGLAALGSAIDAAKAALDAAPNHTSKVLLP
jgi:hypothetical protein